jgi:hypothetical protein
MPTATVGTLYTTPVVVNGAMTINAVAYTASIPVSAVGSATYVIQTAWYSAGGTWTNRKQITINHAQVSGSASLAGFPVLISLTDPNLQALARSDAADILFTAGDGLTKLNHEIESYNSATGQLTAWVNVPSVSNSADTALYVYYGNPAAVPQQNAPAVWDPNYKAVWHFSNANDSTSNANNASLNSSTPTTGKIGSAVAFNGVSDTISVPNSASLMPTSGFTVSMWVKRNGAQARFTTLAVMEWNGDSSPTYVSYALELNRNNIGSDRVSILAGKSGGLTVIDSSANQIPDGVWTLVTATWNGATLALYVNGVQNAAAPLSVPLVYAASRPFDLGGDTVTNGDRFKGSLDETRFSSAARSADWIATEYNNHNAPASFYTVGAQESSSAAAGNRSANGSSGGH